MAFITVFGIGLLFLKSPSDRGWGVIVLIVQIVIGYLTLANNVGFEKTEYTERRYDGGLLVTDSSIVWKVDGKFKEFTDTKYYTKRDNLCIFTRTWKSAYGRINTQHKYGICGEDPNVK